MTEEEQVEAIKGWFQKHANKIMLLLSVIFIGIAGAKYWEHHQQKINTQASSAYENMMLAATNQNEKNIAVYATQLIKDFSGTVYADVAHLTLAKQYVMQKKLPEAIKHLDAVVSHAQMSTLKQVASIRLARIYSAQNKYDKALSILKPLQTSAYKAVSSELEGDLYVAKGEYQLAAASYDLAIKEVHQRGVENLYLEMKANQVASHVKSKAVLLGKTTVA